MLPKDWLFLRFSQWAAESPAVAYYQLIIDSSSSSIRMHSPVVMQPLRKIISNRLHCEFDVGFRLKCYFSNCIRNFLMWSFKNVMKLRLNASECRASALLLVGIKYSTSSSWKVHTAAQQSEFRFYSHIHLCLTNKLHYIPHWFQPRVASVLPPLNLRVLRFLPSIIFICAAFETEQMCFAMYCTHWESGSGSVFIAAFSCLEMGPSEQRQYFTGAWQAAAKVFTAWLQCGKMDPARDAHAARGLRTERALTRCCLILYIVYKMSFFKEKKKKRTKDERKMIGMLNDVCRHILTQLSPWVDGGFAFLTSSVWSPLGSREILVEIPSTLPPFFVLSADKTCRGKSLEEKQKLERLFCLRF